MLRTLVAALVAAVALSLSASAAHGQEAGPGDGVALEVTEGEVEASDLIEQWAALTGRVVTIDPQTLPIRIKFAGAARLDAGILRQVLDAHDIVMVEREGMLQAHHRRNINQKVGPPWDLVQGLAPDDDRLITSVTQVRHGAGNAIFATVRGLLTRDTNRIGNILYVQGPEVIIIVDLAHTVRYYQEIIAMLDQPAPAPTARPRWRATVYEVRQAAWTRLQATAATAAARADALRATLADPANGVVRLAEGQFLGSEPVSVDRGVKEGRETLNLSLQLGYPVRGGPPAGDGKLVSTEHGLHVKLTLEFANETGAMSLTLNTRIGQQRGDGPVVQSFSGRGGAEPTDIVLVLD